MKNLYYKIITLMSCMFLLFSRADGMEETLDHNNIKSFLETHSRQYEQLMGSSIGKNIVVFLGNTGCGTSTLINYLSGKELWCDEYGRVDLRNPDENSMKIGHNRYSETSLPQSMAVTIEQESFQFYDLPGFYGNRGITNKLFNASFIKSIIENAKTVRFVFVVSMEEFEAREIFHNLTQDLKDLIRDQNISDISCLVVTKCRNEIIMRDRLENWFSAETEAWRGANKVAKMYEPNENERVLPNDIQPIIDVIRRTTAKRILDVNISFMFYYADIDKLEHEKIEIKNLDENFMKLFYNRHKESSLLQSTSENIEGRNLNITPEPSILAPIFLEEDPTVNSLNSIEEGQLGLFAKYGKLYCKISGKDSIEIIGDENVVQATGKSLPRNIFDKIMGAVTDKIINLDAFGFAIQMEEQHAPVAGKHYNDAYENISDHEWSLLLQFLSLNGYISNAVQNLNTTSMGAILNTSFQHCHF